MPIFKKKAEHGTLTSDTGGARRRPQSETFGSRVTSSPPQSPAVNSPASSRGVFRGVYDSPLPSQGMSLPSHAALLLASNANSPGPYSFLPPSQAPAYYQARNRMVAPWQSSALAQDGLPASLSLPQVTCSPRVHSGSLVSPFDSSMMLPNPHDPSLLPANSPRGSTPSVRPLRIRKAPAFPFPSEAAALHTLARVLRTETKRFRITDFIDIEEGRFAAVVEAQEKDKTVEAGIHGYDAAQWYNSRGERKSMWDGEEEDETVSDCVRDKMEDGGEGASRWKSERMERSEKRRRERQMRMQNSHLFGTHLEDLPDFGLSPTIVGGYMHEVPTVMAAAIEELIDSRLKEPNFFSSRPDRKQLFDLVARFDQGVATNASHGRLVAPLSLRKESTQSIYSLLVTYLSALPHTVVPRPLVDALWCWCVSPSITRAQRARSVRGNDDDDASESEHEASDEEEDTPNYADRLQQREREFLDLPSFRVQIRIARHVLLLLSRRQFSLLLYLMTFIRAVLRLDGDSDEEDGDRTCNGVALHDIARAFGGVILGGKDWKRRNSVRQREETGDRDRTTKEQKIMTWLVNHWGRIASAYEADDFPGEKLGKGGRPRASSLPTKRPSERPELSAAGSPVRLTKGTPLSKVITPMSGGGDVQKASREADHGPSDSETLTDGSTASSSDWEELPIVSTRPSQKTADKKLPGDITQGQPTMSVDTDILEYYLTDTQEKLSETLPLGGKRRETDLSDDISVYSCDDQELGTVSQGRTESGGAPYSSVAKLPSEHTAAREVVALRKQLQQALDERDEARKIVKMMQSVVVDAVV